MVQAEHVQVKPMGRTGSRGEAEKSKWGRVALALDAEHCVTTASQHAVLTQEIRNG